jgi:hypothetical protein
VKGTFSFTLAESHDRQMQSCSSAVTLLQRRGSFGPLATVALPFPVLASLAMANSACSRKAPRLLHNGTCIVAMGRCSSILLTGSRCLAFRHCAWRQVRCNASRVRFAANKGRPSHGRCTARAAAPWNGTVQAFHYSEPSVASALRIPRTVLCPPASASRADLSTALVSVSNKKALHLPRRRNRMALLLDSIQLMKEICALLFLCEKTKF